MLIATVVDPYLRCIPNLFLSLACHQNSFMTALRILIAEDDAMIGMFLSDLLEAMGHSVCAVTDTEGSTVAAALHHLPDLMIVDEGLRDGSGIVAVEEIAITLSVPHIFATGDCLRVLRAEPNATVLQKPFTAPALVQAIERAMQPDISIA